MHINKWYSITQIKYPTLPKKKHFYSSLNDEKRGKGNGHTSDEQYDHLQNVWKEFKFIIFIDFHKH